tara:strand:+ start:10343 stop:10633 length:291 start_codon:yes stop_codon:yes gene_type:complete
MARGRIFSSRRMFSSRRSSFGEPSKQAGPLGVMLGLTAAAIIIFVIGIFVGRSMPHAVPAPIALGEPVTPLITPDALPDDALSDTPLIEPVTATED